MGWIYSLDGRTRNVYKILMRKHLGKWPLGKPKEDDREISFEDLRWMKLAEDRVQCPH
jgi:hypothetical protein